MPLRIAFQLANPVSQDKSRQFASIGSWVFRILYIIFSLGFGAALLCLPWFSFWDNNYLLYMYPEIRPLVSNSYFKGAVLGLGVADILIGIREIVRLMRNPKRYSY